MSYYEPIIDKLNRADEAGQGGKQRDLATLAFKEMAEVIIQLMDEAGHSTPNAVDLLHILVDEARPDGAYQCEQCEHVEHGDTVPEQCPLCNGIEFERVYTCPA